MLAAGQGNADIVEALLKAGANPRATAAGPGSVLSQAVLGGNRRVVADLVRAAPGLHLGDGWRDRAIGVYSRLRSGWRLIARLDAVRQGIR